jgi:hypothetical protein
MTLLTQKLSKLFFCRSGSCCNARAFCCCLRSRRHARSTPHSIGRLTDADLSVIKVSIEEFLELLIQHVPDRYVHGIRHFGLFSPAGKHQFATGLFALLGQIQRPRPKRLSWENLTERNFGYNPRLDDRSECMRWVGRIPGVSALAGAA